MVVLGGFLKRRLLSFGCLILGFILITYAILGVILEIDGSKGIRRDSEMTIVWPNKSPEPTAVGAFSSAVAVHVASRRWLSFFR